MVLDVLIVFESLIGFLVWTASEKIKVKTVVKTLAAAEAARAAATSGSISFQLLTLSFHWTFFDLLFNLF